MAEKFKIRKGDKVVVLTGKDRGKEGEVVRVLREERRALVSGINVAKRHVKPGRGTAGGITDKELPIHISNLALRDPKDGKPTKVGFKTLGDGRKVRFARRSGETIDA
jgi:large subunit ribosomal protein L24